MKKNIILNVSLGLLVTIVLFIFTVAFIPALLPPHLFEGPQYYVTLILLELIPLGLGILFYLLLSKDKFSDIVVFSKGQFRENKSNLIVQSLLAIAMAVSGYSFIVFIQLVWLKLLESMGYTPITETLPPIETFPVFLLGILSVSIVPAVTEELVFRGMFQKGLLRHKKPLGAILISSALFMLMHSSLETVIYTFVLGALIGYLAYSTGSIIPSVAYHAANNAMAVFGLYLYSAFPQFLEMEGQVESMSELGVNEITAMALPAGISLCFIALFLWLFTRVSKRPPKNPNLTPIPAASKAVIIFSAILLIGLMALLVISTQFV